MRLSERTLSDELRREANSVPIPEDLWNQISRRLDDDPSAARRHTRSFRTLLEQIGSALVITAAAGVFWLAVVPMWNRASEVGARPVQQGRSVVHPSPYDIPPDMFLRAWSDDMPKFRTLRISIASHIHTPGNIVASQ